MKRIALVVFRGTIAAKVAAQCTTFPVFEVGSSQRLVTAFCGSGELGQYDYIVAMGVFTQTARALVHVEEVCETGGLNTALADGGDFKITRTLGASWCQQLACGLRASYPMSQAAFLHIPSGSDPQKLAALLESKLRKF